MFYRSTIKYLSKSAADNDCRNQLSDFKSSTAIQNFQLLMLSCDILHTCSFMNNCAGWFLSTLLIWVVILLFACFIVIPLRNGVSSWLLDLIVQTL